MSVAIATGAFASSFCDDLAQLGTSLSSPAESPDQRFALSEDGAAQAGCQTSLNIGGGKSLHCMWAFAYRSDAATEAFETLLRQVANCGGESVMRDQDVNHPDFYDLHLFTFADSTVGVSLKDKGALSQTLVFLTFVKVAKP
ncbi:hypothetical protein [Sulfitobacter sp.]|uniref:hypothetical protein n=1 Tax=Sulfitobacter sp. TaxID=1903071 RepID=UPI003002466F